MPASIGVNLRVTGYCSQGGRKYMEDFFSVAYQQSEDEKDLEFAFIGIYDGHGGSEAATFAKEHLINLIVSQKLFWSDNDDDILRAIRNGYIATHWAMWREQDKWPKTASGLPSTAGTTASIAFIRHGKIYIGHAGDSGIVLGYTDDNDKTWRARPLTQDHKPECNVEKERIENSGGKVVIKSGVPRVVWNRPRLGHKGPVRRSTPIDEIPFLAVARSLGDLWSYNSALNQFVVSPEPDVRVLKIEPKKYRCLVFGTDGLWNVLSPAKTVEIVRYAEQVNDRNALTGEDKEWINPSKCLVDKALERWSTTRMRADNTSVVILMLDPPGPPGRPKRDGLRTYADQMSSEISNEFIPDGTDKNFTMYDHSTKEVVNLDVTPMPTNGLQIMVKYDNPTVSEFEAEISHLQKSTVASTSSAEYNSVNSGCNSELSYMSSFAESYNSLLNSTFEMDHSYTSYQTHTHVQEPHPSNSNNCYDDTYSLTKLETRNEQFGTYGTSRNVYDEPSTSTFFRDYHQRHQYDCISSSYLHQQPPKEIAVHQIDVNTMDDSVQTNLLYESMENIEYATPNGSKFSENVEDDTSSQQLWSATESSLSGTAAATTAPIPSSDKNEHIITVTPVTPINPNPVQITENGLQSKTSELSTPVFRNGSSNLDESIQINEISSSSKDNEDKTYKNSESMEIDTSSSSLTVNNSLTAKQPTKSAAEYKSSDKASPNDQYQRMTRSRQISETASILKANAATLKKPKAKAQNIRNLRNRMLTIIKRTKQQNRLSSKPKVQNENFVSRSPRRTANPIQSPPAAIVQEISVDFSKRTLRSKNSIGKDLNDSRSSNNNKSTILRITAKAKNNQQTVKSKFNQKLNISQPTTISGNCGGNNSNSSSRWSKITGTSLPVARTLREKVTKTNNQEISTKPKPSMKSLSKSVVTAPLRRATSWLTAATSTTSSTSRSRNQLQKRK